MFNTVLMVCDLRDQGIPLLLGCYICPGCGKWHIEVSETLSGDELKRVDLNGGEGDEKFDTMSSAVESLAEIINDYDPDKSRGVVMMVWETHALEIEQNDRPTNENSREFWTMPRANPMLN